MTDTASAAPSDAELFPLIEKHFGMVPRRDDTVIDRRTGHFHDAQRYRDFAADVLSACAQPTPPAVVEPPELSPDFTDTARAALLWVLWHHQGGSSPVGQEAERKDMTQDEIIAMAREAGYFLYDLSETHGVKTVETDEADEWAQLERFAALVAAAERDACAQVCEKFKQDGYIDSDWADMCAAAIRARGIKGDSHG